MITCLRTAPCPGVQRKHSISLDHVPNGRTDRKFKRHFYPRYLRERAAGAPTAWTQHRIFVPLPAPAGMLDVCFVNSPPVSEALTRLSFKRLHW
jgi:hypothetical protein